MGTPDFAVPCVHVLANHDSCNLVAVVCQPDRVRGRKKAPQPPPVKVAANAHGIPVLQPTRIKTGAFAEQLAAFNPTLAVVAAYGRILPASVLDLPKRGSVNLHASLLPRWRGAAPIQWCIAEGDDESGVCLIQMDEGLDTGDVLAVRKQVLSANETGQSLHDSLAQLSADLLTDTLPDVLAGRTVRVPQPADGVTYARMLSRADGKLDWTLPARVLERRIRAFYPWPGAFTTSADKSIKLFPPVRILPSHGSNTPGTVVDISPDGVRISTADGDILVTQLQLQGRRRMSASEFANGRALIAGDTLG